MGLDQQECVDAIALHSRGLAQDARDNLDARVEHCPGWSVADLVWHVTEVQWFWATIAENRLGAPPDGARRPVRPATERLVAEFEAGVERLLRVLREADPEAAAWTWAPTRQDVGFIVRHQVQEAAVHHWDAAHAAGRGVEIARPVAVDSVEEFLTFSVASEDDPAAEPLPDLTEPFALLASDAGRGWTVAPGAGPRMLAVRPGIDPDAPTISAPAADLLLWLYDRVAVGTGDVPDAAVAAFRAACFTD
jgi:uncharacterized protein (TIGR03083 family)